MLVSDYIHPMPRGGRCRVRIYEDGARVSEATQDRATFDLVEFSHYEPRAMLRPDGWRKEIGEPSWSALDRAIVEALIGEAV